MIKINKSEFLISCPNLESCPDYDLAEIALVGRSNVGKSSFINTLAGRKNLAYTSNTPGKTRLINLYMLQEKLIIADLPGYGYAKVSKKEQQEWGKILEEYLLKRKNLKYAVQMIDSRHDVQKNDLQMREWLNYHNLSVLTIATKIDSISKNKITASLNSIAKSLDCDVVGFSAKTGYGREQVLKLIFEKF